MFVRPFLSKTAFSRLAYYYFLILDPQSEGPIKWSPFSSTLVFFYPFICVSFSLFVSFSVFPISKVSLNLQYGRTELFGKTCSEFFRPKGPKMDHK